MGRLSPLDGIGPKEIRLDRLIERATDGVVQEVVLATNFTNEGEATAHYIGELLAARGLKVSRLARGVPVGGELEYVDSGTLAQALRERRTLDALTRNRRPASLFTTGAAAGRAPNGPRAVDVAETAGIHCPQRVGRARLHAFATTRQKSRFRVHCQLQSPVRRNDANSPWRRTHDAQIARSGESRTPHAPVPAASS